MARIFPSDLDRLVLAGAHRAEIATLRLLRRRLPDAYTVFHGVHWSREHARWSQFGEVDFVVVNRAGEALLVEQKNGVLEQRAEGLVKRYPNGEKNVADQIRRSLDKVREKFRHQHRGERAPRLDYLIYCPDHRLVRVNAAAIDASRVVAAGARDGLVRRIEALLGPGVEAGDGWCEEVLGFFRQTLDLVPDIHAHVNAQEEAFVRCSGELARTVARLEMEPFRLRVRGTAGCGKSLLAGAVFARALAAGRRPLLLCFNRPLAERLKARLAAGGRVDTWHGFCARFLEARGERLDFTAMRDDPGFWGRVQDRVTGAAIPEEWRFDALIVDEGQDFEQEWYEIARLFLREGAEVVWLEDPDQNLYGKEPVHLAGFVGLRAEVNYRSPARIAAFLRETLPFEFEPGNALPGLGVEVHGYDDPAEQPGQVARVVAALRRRGFEYRDIVVLTCRGHDHSVLSARARVGNVTLRRFTGQYDLFGNQLLTEGRLTFDSVYRFKGQEAPAVVLIDIDPEAARLDHALRVLYCGMTRATVRLELLVRRTNPACARFLERGGAGGDTSATA